MPRGGVALAAWHTLPGVVIWVSAHDVHAGADTAHGSFTGWDETSGLDLPALSPHTAKQVSDRLVSRDFDAWSEAVARVGNCAHPIRLQGSSQTVDKLTGEIVASYSSSDEPLGITYVPCGNRRASECLSCSRLYAADMFHLIRAGVTGGKTVPASVADHPLVFATLTAPSFGKVHGHRGATGSCHPGTRRLCQHGRSRTCHSLHDADADGLVGQPLCVDCYDYASHVVWQWWAPDLWRRFTITLRRLVAKTLAVPATRLAEVATVQYAKVAEYQLRGAVHFHALVRLDGPHTPDGFAPAPEAIDANTLAKLVQAAAATVRLKVPGVDVHDPTRLLVFGRQLDVRPVRTSRRTDDPDQALTPGQVAGYLAKYATKSADDDTGNNNTHRRRLRHTVADLATRAERTTRRHGETESPYELLGKWVHMLGFRGHFASKSRRYSITLSMLRRARQRAGRLIAQTPASARPLDLAALEADLLADDDTETTLVIGNWQFLGTGWNTGGDTTLATAAAARAREYAQWKAQHKKQHTHPYSRGTSR